MTSLKADPKQARRIWSGGFALFSVLLLSGYYSGLNHHELEPYLKGLNTLQHFLIHYSFGVLVAILTAISWLLITKKQPNVAALLLVSVFISHLPDFRFAIRRVPHDGWEVIFLFHTVVDEHFFLIWPFLAGSIIGGIIYVRLRKSLERPREAA